MLHEGPGSRKAGEGTSSYHTAVMILESDLRYQVVSCLREAPNQTLKTDELVDQISERTGEQLHREHLTIRLHHVHLPKLAEKELIEFDPRASIIQYIPDKIIEYLLDQIEAWKTEYDQ